MVLLGTGIAPVSAADWPTFTPLVQSGKSYRYSARCKMGGMNSKSESVLEVATAEACTVTVDSTVDGKKSHEVLRARRTGDCKR